MGASTTLFAIGMGLPEGPWCAAGECAQAEGLLFSAAIPSQEVEDYIIQHPLFVVPAFYWQHRPVEFGREIRIPVLDTHECTADRFQSLLKAQQKGGIIWSIPASSEELEDFYPVLKKLLLKIIAQDNKVWEVETLFSVLREGIENSARHGNQWQSLEHIEIEMSYRNQQLRVRVRDEGPGFKWRDILEQARTTSPAEIARRRGTSAPGGMGMPMMVKYLDVLEYNDAGNELIMGMN